MTELATKIYASRSSATDVLRKLGIKPADYDIYVTKEDKTKFVCRVGQAELAVANDKTMAATKKLCAVEKPTLADQLWDVTQQMAKKAAAKPQPVANWQKAALDEQPAKKVVKPKTTGARSVASVARDLIVAGATTDEVWEMLKKEFKLDDKKRGYPAWYRSDCKKKGLIK